MLGIIKQIIKRFNRPQFVVQSSRRPATGANFFRALLDSASLPERILPMVKMIRRVKSFTVRSFGFQLLLALVMFSFGASAAQAQLADSRELDRDRDGKVVSTYVQNFHVFSGIFLRRMVDNGSAAQTDILIHAFVDIRADAQGNPHCAAFDEFADYQFFFDQTRSVDGSVDSFADGALRGQVGQLRELKALFPHMKVLASIGGFSAGVNGFEAAAAT